MKFTRRLVLSTAALGALALTACSGLYHVSSDVSTFGEWPADRKPGSYAFERLPSQQKSERQDTLEAKAREALEKAGFKPATDPKSADVIVALGARSSPTDYAAWDDPMWRHWRMGWRWGPPSRFYSYGPLDRRYDREVALLLRDRASGEPIYEARASNDGLSEGDPVLLGAMFQSAMADFPQAKPDSHRVTVQVQR